MNKVKELKSNNLIKVKVVCQEFLDECQYMRRLRPATIRSYKYIFKVFIKLMPEIEFVDQLTYHSLNKFFIQLQTRKREVGKNLFESGVKESTTHTYARKLNCFFKWLVRNQYLIDNPLKNIHFPTPTYEDKRALTDTEIQRVIASIHQYANNIFILKRDIAMINVLLYCGIRKGELLGLRVQDIELDKQLLTVRKDTSKSKKTRYLPINPKLKISLIDYLEYRKIKKYSCSGLFVSSSKDDNITEHGLRHWVDRIKKHSKVHFHLHRCRHTFACALESLNVSPTKIQKLMGHSDIGMTMKYLRSTHAEDMKIEINALSF